VARLGQAVFGAATCVLVAATAWRLLGRAVGVLSGVVLALYLPHVYLSGVFYVECTFAMLIALTVYLAVWSLDTNHLFISSALTGVSLALTALTRPVFLSYAPFLCAALLFASERRPARQLAACALLVVAMVVTILPWTLRNYATYGKMIPVSSGFGTKLWQGNNEISAGDADDRELFWYTPVWQQRLQSLAPAEQAAIEERYAEIGRRAEQLQRTTGDEYVALDAILFPVALDYMRSHPRRTLELFGKKLVTLFSPFSKTITDNADTSSRNRLLAALSYLPMLAFAIGGMCLGVYERRGLAILYALIVSNAVAYGILNTCTRFRLPLDPYLIVFASLALCHLWQRWQARQSTVRRHVASVAA